MGDIDFPTWFGIGSYGGLAIALLSAAGVAAFALRAGRGSPLQLARTILVCLAAASLMLPPVWWNQNRLDLYGPSLAAGEVLFWLCWSSLFGWLMPLSMLAAYMLLAAPQRDLGFVVATRARFATPSPALAALDDPARRFEPLGAGRAWGQLAALDGETAGRTIALMRQLTLLGRELDNDIVVDDERTSRHHAEIHWDHGRVHLVDRNSMNGTLVNRQSVRGLVLLRPGDIVEMGTQRFRFEAVTGAAGEDSAAEETRKSAAATANHSPTPSMPPLTLVALNGPVAGSQWQVTEAVTTIGRDPEQRICLPDESVSRHHAQIVRQRTGYFIADLASSNGTFLNGAPVDAPLALTPGALLRVGDVELRCQPAHVPHSAADPAEAALRAAQPTTALFG